MGHSEFAMYLMHLTLKLLDHMYFFLHRKAGSIIVRVEKFFFFVMNQLYKNITVIVYHNAYRYVTYTVGPCYLKLSKVSQKYC